MPMLQSMRKHVITLMILHNDKYRTGDIFSRPVSFYETVLFLLNPRNFPGLFFCLFPVPLFLFKHSRSNSVGTDRARGTAQWNACSHSFS